MASVYIGQQESDTKMKKDKKVIIPQRPKQTSIHIRLDDDVLGFFKNGGPGYQLRINAALRAYVEANRK